MAEQIDDTPKEVSAPILQVEPLILIKNYDEMCDQITVVKMHKETLALGTLLGKVMVFDMSSLEKPLVY